MASFSFDYSESNDWVWAYGHKDDGDVYAIHISGGGDPSTPNGFEDWVIKCDKKGDLTYYIRHGVPDADKLQKGRILVSSPDQNYISWQDKDYLFREGEWSFIGVKEAKKKWQIAMEEEDEQRDAETQLAEEVEHLKKQLEEVKDENKELKEEAVENKKLFDTTFGEVMKLKGENKILKEEHEFLRGEAEICRNWKEVVAKDGGWRGQYNLCALIHDLDNDVDQDVYDGISFPHPNPDKGGVEMMLMYKDKKKDTLKMYPDRQTLKEENKKLKEENKKLKEENKKLKEDNDTWVAVLHTATQKLEGKNDELEEENRKLDSLAERIIEDKDDKIKELQEEIDKLKILNK